MAAMGESVPVPPAWSVVASRSVVLMSLGKMRGSPGPGTRPENHVRRISRRGEAGEGNRHRGVAGLGQELAEEFSTG